jgi:uncharacterized protein YkwD
MTKRILATVAAAMVLVAAAAAPGSARPDGLKARATQFQLTLLAHINAFRSSRGLSRVRLSPALTAAATAHSSAMARRGFFSHTSANGTSFSQRIAQYYPVRGFRRWTVGENLAWGGPDIGPGTTLRLWLGSPMHRSVLLTPAWREVGLAAVHSTSAPGVYGGRAATVVTADFGARGR